MTSPTRCWCAPTGAVDEKALAYVRQKAYSSHHNRRYLRRRHVGRTIPEPKGQRAHRRRNEVERTINRLKNSRAVATRYDKRAHVFQGAVITAAIRLRLRP